MKLKIGEVELGKPWRPYKNSLSVLVPLIRKNAPERNYVTAEEVKKKLKITDTGNIDKTKVEANVDKPVFIRSGTMFEGQNTQSRAATGATVIMPNKPVEIPVNCIHQSHPIRSGACFFMAGSAPESVHRSLVAGIQSQTWNAISRYGMPRMALHSTNTNMATSVTPDNLVQTTKEVAKFKTDIDNLIKKMPIETYQTGVIILDFDGVVGIECFDNPESWKAVCKEVTKKYRETLSKRHKHSLFELNEKNLVPMIKDFLGKLSTGVRKTTFKIQGAKTVNITGTEVIGEYTVIHGKAIHMIGMRKEEQEEPPKGRTVNYMSIDTTPTDTTANYYVPRGTVNVLTAAATGTRWKDLKDSSNMSTATLSKRISECEESGLITKEPVMVLGKPGINYKLTKKGKKTLNGLNYAYAADI